MNLAGPVEGLRVIDISTILAGPLCCQILGDFGADVIKVEHPRMGDGLRGHGPAKNGSPIWWKEVGRNKRTVAIDLKDPDGADLLRRLVATADVLVENFRPGTLERWGLSPESLIEECPGLVVVRITGFGQEGPYSDRPGFGTLAEAMSGFAAATGEPDGPPILPPFGLADSICGIAASSAVMMALRHRDRTGEGQVIDMSILQPIMMAVGPGPSVFQQLGTVEPRRGNRSGNNAPRNAYRTADDRWVAVSTSAQQIAERVLALVGHPEVIEEEWFSSGRGRAEHGDLLDEYVGSWIRDRARSEVLDEFARVGAAAAPVYDARDIVADPHVIESEMLVEVDDPDLGALLQHNVLWRMSRTPGRIRHTGRALGENTTEILGELGVSPAQIDQLKSKGTIR